MKRFLFILIVFGIVFGVDMIVGIFSKDLILNAPDVGINQTNSVQALFYRKSDILILGPSTANHHYNTKILEDSLRLSAYNSGYDGKNILYSAMVFYSYLQRCSPKLVCMDMLAPMMNDTWNASVSEMNAFYGLSSEVDRVIDDVSSMIKKMELCSNLYRYNNS